MTPTAPTLAPDSDALALVTARIARIRCWDFDGKLPAPLARVLEIYRDLARERLARGEPLDGILDGIRRAGANAKAMIAHGDQI